MKADDMIEVGSNAAVEYFRGVHPEIEAMSELDRHRWLSGFMIAAVTYTSKIVGAENAALTAHAAADLTSELLEE